MVLITTFPLNPPSPVPMYDEFSITSLHKHHSVFQQGDNNAMASLTYSFENGIEKLVADIKYPSMNKQYLLESCGEDGHVLLEKDPSLEAGDADEGDRSLIPQMNLPDDFVLEDDLDDRQSNTIIHVTFWYNPALFP